MLTSLSAAFYEEDINNTSAMLFQVTKQIPKEIHLPIWKHLWFKISFKYAMLLRRSSYEILKRT